MSNMWYLPIQPLSARYSKEWIKWIPDFFNMYYDVHTIEGTPLTSELETGQFLNPTGSLYYVSGQLQMLASLFHNKTVKYGDVFFIADIEFPGHLAEAIRNLSVLTGIKVYIFGFLHASCWTEGDMAEQLKPWQRFLEPAAFEACDKVFVASKHFKDYLIGANMAEDIPIFGLQNKIIVTGNIWDSSDILKTYPKFPKEKIVIFPHRFSKEKDPTTFLNVARILKKNFPDWKFLITTSNRILDIKDTYLSEQFTWAYVDGVVDCRVALSRKEYFEWMAKARIMVSTTKEENWGYCATEAATFDTWSLCPDAFSYKELLPVEMLYKDESDLLKQLEFLMRNDYYAPNYSYYLRYADHSLDRMYESIQEVIQEDVKL